VNRADTVIDRHWLVFFCEAERPAWWARFLRPGYRHVAACAWFDDQERWVYFNPSRRGTVILIYRDEEFGGRLTQLLQGSALVLRVVGTRARRSTPFGWWCTGAVKALLCIRSGALSPRQLALHLLRKGAVIVRAQESDEFAFRIRHARTAAGSGSSTAA
jgi:hypothetical protein